ncbi:MAG TPA: hypothetical protein VK717_08725 [Opitutaceae bacterium]|jgi:4-amino-4-deoxy-L-arabinose transferase-like glycosyltransferase|nr:hypothetical protein [Opitutaceae bacterium]
MADAPPVPAAASAAKPRGHWCLTVPAAIAFAYGCGQLNWYLDTPLGRVPVLDEHENLALAETIFHGTLPAEPFYRAPGYALALAGLRWLGVPAAGLFSAALLLGVVLHALNALLVARLAQRWFGHGAAWAAGLLYALHPVFVHYATQALDATPSLTLFLFGLNFFAAALDAPGAPHPWAAASICWAMATLTRPNFLFVWFMLPVLAFARASTSTFRQRNTAASLMGAGLFAAMSLWQWQVSHAAGFLPWQGAYNLWAANRPGANGRYYIQEISLQQVNVPPALAAGNAARGESIWFFQQETKQPPTDIAAMNAHWRQRFLGYVFSHPGAWLGLMARKTYALLNDWEQYNNKTFAFHKARSPWLRWNPLSWGILFVLGLAGAARFASESPRIAWSLMLVASAYAASVLLFFVSARFRLPLASLLCLFAGGALARPGFWRNWQGKKKSALAVGLILAAAVTFSNFDEVRDHETFMEDHALLAGAAASVGESDIAWTEARATLALRSWHPAALPVAVASYFNLLLANAAEPGDEPDWRQACRHFLARPGASEPNLRAVAALALWRAGAHNTALAEWRKLSSTPSALAARLLAGDSSVSHEQFVAIAYSAWSQPLVRLAAARLNLPAPKDAPIESTSSPELAVHLFSTNGQPAPP